MPESLLMICPQKFPYIIVNTNKIYIKKRSHVGLRAYQLQISIRVKGFAISTLMETCRDSEHIDLQIKLKYIKHGEAFSCLG